MRRCITPIGCTTARWLAAANRLYAYSTAARTLQAQTPFEDESNNASIIALLSRWKPSAATLHPKSNHDLSSLAESATIETEQTHQASKVYCQSMQQEPPATNNERDTPPLAPHIKPTAIIGKNASHAPRPNAYERRPLPLSPLMDPAAIAAKQKHHAPKAQPRMNPEPFQQILAKNPYALALATPLRRCQLTYSGLPSFFLQDFNLMAHPETGDPWYVPRSLANKHAPTAPPKTADLGIEPGTELEAKDEKQSDSQREKIGRKHTPDVGFTAYTLSSQLALRALTEKDGYTTKGRPKRALRQAKQIGIPVSAHVQFVPDRYRRAKLASKAISKAAWRTDMHEFVLELLRRRTVEDLVHVIRLKRGYVVGCSGWEDAKAKPQVGAFLWTGGNGDIEMDAPPEFATIKVNTQKNKTRKVPVYNLRALLGREKLAELREKLLNGIFQKELLVLRHKRVTVELEMRLWKLQGYLAEYRDFFRDGEQQDGKDEWEDEFDDSEADETDEDE